MRAQADAEALIRDHGGGAYAEARQREREPNQPTTARNSRPGNSTNSIITSVVKAASKTIKMTAIPMPIARLGSIFSKFLSIEI